MLRPLALLAMVALLATGNAVARTAEASANGAGQRVRAADVAGAVLAALHARLAGSGHSGALVEVDAGLRDQQIAGGRVRIVVGEVAGRWPRPRVGVPVLLEVDGRATRRLTVWAGVHDPRRVLVYAQDAAAHAAAGAVSTRTAVADMACCADEPLASIDAAAGMRLRRPVRAGAPVLAGDFEATPDVAAREPVSIQVRRGPVRIETTGRALADASIGARVPVRASGADGPVEATVTGKGEVAIE